MEEIFYGLVGLGMIYTWIHSFVIYTKIYKTLATYERVITIIAWSTLTLLVIGTIS